MKINNATSEHAHQEHTKEQQVVAKSSIVAIVLF
jgi:hypothetical protein